MHKYPCTLCGGHGPHEGDGHAYTTDPEQPLKACGLAPLFEDTRPVAVPHPSAVARLLQHSWKCIHYEYDMLTQAERACVTREQHADLVQWLRRTL